jgi:hypothetical protein
MKDTAQNKPVQDSFSPAIKRFNDHLEKAGMDEKSRGFLVGRLVKVITTEVMNEIGKVLGKEGMNRIEAIKDKNDQQKELERVFLEKTGKSLIEYRDEVAERLVKDFEAK